ncbi:MAG: GTP pyrophosphokinase family protein [Clostridia bacterium]|nr:GTP pyrophosphokinase family protein [Clostridia bacterium]
MNEKINAENEEREGASESFFSDIVELREMEYLYNAAIKQLTMRFEILNDEFRIKYARSPIHHIESRLKSTQSIINKLIRKNYDITIESAKKNLNDIAGVRVVCCYIDDVYSVADMLLRQTDIRLVHKQDYIETPNYNGYRSLHLDIEIPIYLSEHTEYVAVEIQLRTVAMDFWASLEHDLRYKSDKDIPDSICKEMLESSDEINALDVKMQEIYKKIQAL